MPVGTAACGVGVEPNGAGPAGLAEPNGVTGAAVGAGVAAGVGPAAWNGAGPGAGNDFAGFEAHVVRENFAGGDGGGDDEFRLFGVGGIADGAAGESGFRVGPTAVAPEGEDDGEDREDREDNDGGAPEHALAGCFRIGAGFPIRSR